MFLDEFKKARLVSVPIISITSTDQPNLVNTLLPVIGDEPVIEWDIARGAKGRNDAGKAVVSSLFDSPEKSRDIILLLDACQNMPESCALFIHNAQKFITNIVLTQRLVNLRSLFSQNFRTVILLSPSMTLPEELENDILVLNEPLPDGSDYEEMVTSLYEVAKEDNPKIPKLTTERITKSVGLLRGLSPFSANQALALSISKEQGIDLDTLWQRKKQAIEGVDGLKITYGGVKFDEVKGLTVIKQFFTDIFNGANPPTGVIYLDEIEKSLAGASKESNESSGTSKDALGVLLSAMQDYSWRGNILYGVSGTGKSYIAKATASSFGVPNVTLDLGAAKGHYVGDSEKMIRRVIEVLRSMFGSGAYFLATSNDLSSLPDELRGRFISTWFFNLPDKAEKEAMWSMYLKKFEIVSTSLPDDTSWSSRDIYNCCSLASTMNQSPLYVSKYLTTASRQTEAVEKMRDEANGKFLSTSYPGYYMKEHTVEPLAKRKIRV